MNHYRINATFLFFLYLLGTILTFADEPTAPAASTPVANTVAVSFDLPHLASAKVTRSVSRWLRRNQAKEFKKSGNNPSFSYKPDFKVLNHSTHIQSLVITLDESLDGTHESIHYKTFTYGATRGRLYDLNDLFLPHSDWSHALWPFVSEKLAKRLSKPLVEGAVDYRSFSLDDRALRLYFDQCAVTPCAQGPVEFEIPLDSLKSILKPAFQAADSAHD
jgi:hypothetical protein